MSEESHESLNNNQFVKLDLAQRIRDKGLEKSFKLIPQPAPLDKKLAEFLQANFDNVTILDRDSEQKSAPVPKERFVTELDLDDLYIAQTVVRFLNDSRPDTVKLLPQVKMEDRTLTSIEFFKDIPELENEAGQVFTTLCNSLRQREDLDDLNDDELEEVLQSTLNKYKQQKHEIKEEVNELEMVA